MAEIQEKDKGGGKGKPKKASTKVDMTPMVDLAFLLLTFFMLTTTFAKPNVMQLTMPVDEDKEIDRPPLKASNALTILLGKDDKVYYYDGLLGEPETKLETTDFSASGIRKHLLERNTNPKLFVMIKPLKESRYKNMVDVLDEMNITDTGAYAIVPTTREDMEFIQKETGYTPEGLSDAPAAAAPAAQ